MLAGWLALLAGLALAAPAAAASPASSLHQRIEAAAQLPLPTDPLADRPALEALAAEAARSGASHADRAAVERMIAERLTEAGSLDDAIARIDTGTSLLTAARQSEHPEMGRLLTARAMVDSNRNRLDSALELVTRAEAMLVKAYGAGAAELALNEQTRARVHYRMGNFALADQYYRRSAGHGEPSPRDSITHVSSMVGMAQVASALGNEEESIEIYYRALGAAERHLHPEHLGWSLIYAELGTHLSLTGRGEEAEALGRLAVDFARRHRAADSFDTAMALRSLGNVLGNRGKWEEANALLQAAVAILENPQVVVRQPSVKVDAYQLLGVARLATGQFAEAETAFRKGLASLPANRALPVLTAQVYRGLAQAELGLNRPVDALVSAEAATERLRTLQTLDVIRRSTAELVRARVLVELGRKEEAWQAALPVSRAMEAKLLDDYSTPQGRIGQLALYRNNFGRVALIAQAAGYPEEAFRAAQLASFSEISVSSQALAIRLASANAHAEPLARAVQQLQGKLFSQERERNLAAGKSSALLAEHDAAMAETRAQLDANLAELRRIMPQFDALAKPQPLGLATAQAALRKDAALMLPVQQDNRLLVLVLTKAAISTSVMPLADADMTRAIARLRASATPGANLAFDSASAWRLGQAIFARPVMAALRRTSQIDVLGSGPLMTLPFGMLLTAPPKAQSDGATAEHLPFAIRRFAFSVRPVLGVAVGPGLETGGPFLGVGAPVLPARQSGAGISALRSGLAGLAELPGTASELAEISRQLASAGNVLLTGPRATKQALRAQPLDRFGVVAFATHGLVSGELGYLHEPALVLTGQPADNATGADDALLTASEVALLKLNAEWVILSACNTGAGSEAGAGGYTGLARGFLQAGARGLLVSLWPLRDDIAPQMSAGAVRLRAAGASHAQALQQAQLAMVTNRKQPGMAHPALWAPFVAVGD